MRQPVGHGIHSTQVDALPLELEQQARLFAGRHIVPRPEMMSGKNIWVVKVKTPTVLHKMHTQILFLDYSDYLRFPRMLAPNVGKCGWEVSGLLSFLASSSLLSERRNKPCTLLLCIGWYSILSVLLYPFVGRVGCQIGYLTLPPWGSWKLQLWHYFG